MNTKILLCSYVAKTCAQNSKTHVLVFSTAVLMAELIDL